MIVVNKCERHIGFSMTFENGNTISVQYGAICMSGNRKIMSNKTKNAEIAIWNSKNEFLKLDGRDTKGYCSADEVANYILIAKTLNF